MSKGKSICSVLKTIRKQVADANGIKYEPRVCHYQGECLGTCPACEAEVRYLELQLDMRRQLGKAVAIVGISAGLAALTGCSSASKVAKENDAVMANTEHVLKTGEVVVDEKHPTPATAEKVFGIVEQMPMFRGGDRGLKAFLAENIRYPSECVLKGIEGRVILNMIIERDGSVSHIEVKKGVHPLLDEEAVRVASLMPKWMPGKQMGTAVRVNFTLPVSFSLK